MATAIDEIAVKMMTSRVRSRSKSPLTGTLRPVASFQPFCVASVAIFVARIVDPTLRIFHTGPPSGVRGVAASSALAFALLSALVAFFESLGPMP